MVQRESVSDVPGHTARSRVAALARFAQSSLPSRRHTRCSSSRTGRERRLYNVCPSATKGVSNQRQSSYYLKPYVLRVVHVHFQDTCSRYDFRAYILSSTQFHIQNFSRNTNIPSAHTCTHLKNLKSYSACKDFELWKRCKVNSFCNTQAVAERLRWDTFKISHQHDR